MCQAWTFAEKMCLTGATAIVPANQRRYEFFLLLSLLIPCLRQHCRREAVEKEEVLRGQREKEKGTHLPLADDFALPLHDRDTLPPKRRSPPR